jgi:hypothetical protein
MRSVPKIARRPPPNAESGMLPFDGAHGPIATFTISPCAGRLGTGRGSAQPQVMSAARAAKVFPSHNSPHPRM